MLSFIIRRLFLIIPMALLVITVTWGLIRLAPGTFYSTEKKLPPAVEANIKKKIRSRSAGLETVSADARKYDLPDERCR